MIKLSVAIITFNEELNIRRCLESVLEVADEIVVVDSLSTDNTRKICDEFKVIFIEQKFLGHIGQKNFALTKTTHNHVLSLDADESLNSMAIESIKKVKENWSADGYFLNRLTNYCGKWIYHCGWYPDRKLRILDKRKGKWGGANPHDKIVMEEATKSERLAGKILHYSYPTIQSHIEQTNKFTTIAASEAYNRGVKSSLSKAYLRAFFKFIRDYFFKFGFLDGSAGATICYINALSAFLKYSKIVELKNTTKD